MEVPLWAWWLAGAVGGGATLFGAAFFGAWWLWWQLPKRQVERLRMAIRDPKARADVEDTNPRVKNVAFSGCLAI